MLPRLVIKFESETDHSLVTPRVNYCNFEIELTLVYLIFEIGAGLESLCTVKGTVGSNPTLSAIILITILPGVHVKRTFLKNSFLDVFHENQKQSLRPAHINDQHFP